MSIKKIVGVMVIIAILGCGHYLCLYPSVVDQYLSSPIEAVLLNK